MSTTKKYVSLDKLRLYDEKIKAVISADDATTLAAAKSYADGLATNYDVAGAAASVQSKLDAEIARAKAAEEAAQSAANTAQSEVDALELVVAEKAAQSDLDALEALVGTLPEGTTAKDVVDYVDIKTSGIATEGAMTELGNRVTAVEGKVATIEADYLVEADKEELQGNIDKKADQTALDAVSTVANAAATKTALEAEVTRATEEEARIEALVSAEVERAEEVESGLDTRIKAIEDDYLKAADKEALQTQINTIMNNPDAEGAINSINEFTKYVADHGTIAEGFRTDIDKNKEDIATNAQAIEDLEGSVANTYATKAELASEKSALQAEIDADVKVVADDLAELAEVVNTKANASDVETSVAALQSKDTELAGKITALENKFTGDGSVEDQIATAKQEAIDAAATDATTKANQALVDAKAYADTEDAKIESRVDALETASATHALASDLTALAGRVTTAEGKITTLEGEMDAVEALAAANDAAIKALQAASDTHATKTALEEEIARAKAAEKANADAIAAFVEVSEEEINNLFA